MIDFEVRGELTDHLFSMLRGPRDPDPIRLAQRTREILIQENERLLKSGRDVDGSETAPLKESTIRRGRGGFGPPRLPRISASRLVTRFEVAVARQGDHGYVVRAGWPGLNFVGYLNDGTSHMEARRFVGITASCREQLEEAAHQYGADLLKAGR